MSFRRWLTLAILGFFILAAVSKPEPVRLVQAGEVVLEFRGGTVAMSQIVFDEPFGERPILLCAANNQLDAGVKVGCQGLGPEHGAVSAEVDGPRAEMLTVNWMAMEATQ